MNGHERLSGPEHGPLDDAAAYALGALEEQEAREFERHLESCAICREELARFQPAVDALPLATRQREAPRALRRRVLRRVRAEQRASSGRAWTGARSLFRPLIAGPAVAAVLAAGILITILGGSSGTLVYHSTVGQAKLEVTDGHAQLIVDRLAPLPAGRVYEVWVQHANRSVSPANVLFEVNSAGTRHVSLPGSVSGARAVMVTAEPAGGTLRPTGKPVVITPLV